MGKIHGMSKFVCSPFASSLPLPNPPHAQFLKPYPVNSHFYYAGIPSSYIFFLFVDFGALKLLVALTIFPSSQGLRTAGEFSKQISLTLTSQSHPPPHHLL